MREHKFTFRVEMLHGQDQRVVEADSFSCLDSWMVFYRDKLQGGKVEYWRVKMDCVVAMETKANP